jgi:hypothetical protein
MIRHSWQSRALGGSRARADSSARSAQVLSANLVHAPPQGCPALRGGQLPQPRDDAGLQCADAFGGDAELGGQGGEGGRRGGQFPPGEDAAAPVVEGVQQLAEKFLVKQLAAEADLIALYGCPDGTLCTELRKHPHVSDLASGRLMQTSLAWAEKQFAATGRDDARDLALQMVTGYQGTCVVTQALGDPSLMKKEAQRLERWIDSIVASASASAPGYPG